MNLFAFLKSRLGAISLSAGKTAGMALTAGVLGLNIYNYMNSTPAAQEERVRSFSEILASGGTLPNDTTISISSGATQFATAEERAAKEGHIFDAGDGALAAFDGAMDSASVFGSALGVGEDGLGMGANAATEIGYDGGAAYSANPYGDSAAMAGALATTQTKINKLGEEQAGGLQRASIARASGSNLGSGSNGGFGGSSYGGGSSSSAKGEAAARMGSYALTGSMPKGTTLIASNGEVQGVPGRGRSAFIAGGRDSSSRMGANSQQGRSLRDIAVSSSKVAANANRAANEGTSPFMAREHLSGGIALEDGGDAGFAGTSSSDFLNDMERRERGFAEAADTVDNTEQERQEHRSRLMQNMFSLALATVGACFTIAALMKAYRAGGPYATWALLGAIAAGLVMAGLIAFYLADCAKYIQKYKEQQGWAIAGIVVGSLMVVALGISYIKFPEKDTQALKEGANQQTGTEGSEIGEQGGADKGNNNGFWQKMGAAAKDYAIGAGSNAAMEVGGQYLDLGGSAGESGTGSGSGSEGEGKS